jgi:hypothetical protein
LSVTDVMVIVAAAALTVSAVLVLALVKPVPLKEAATG